ncbi:MAG TPA: 50S ribosomal protein L9 [Ktedonobacterales bacterium]|nr:50S ribosomal protein L9 [Ktedonobacterales bacterium]
MKVILLQDVPGLGKPGEVKEVASGYARNYLLPRELVTPASGAAMANLRDRLTVARRRVEKQQAENTSLAGRLAAVTLTFAVRVGQNDRLYGSVTAQDIADALLEQEGLNVDKRSIELHEPLRQLGTFEIAVRVAPKVEPKITVNIISSEATLAQAEASTSADAAETSAEESSDEEDDEDDEGEESAETEK